MSLLRGQFSGTRCRFPRVSGDEPASNGGDLYPEAFSPRERG